MIGGLEIYGNGSWKVLEKVLNLFAFWGGNHVYLQRHPPSGGIYFSGLLNLKGPKNIMRMYVLFLGNKSAVNDEEEREQKIKELMKKIRENSSSKHAKGTRKRKSENDAGPKVGKEPNIWWNLRCIDGC